MRALATALALAGMAALGGAALAPQPAAAQIELKLNGLHAPEHPVSLTHHFFAERVGQMTDGEIRIDVFDARGLGDAVESVQNMRNGTIAFMTVSASNLSQVVMLIANQPNLREALREEDERAAQGAEAEPKAATG